ncbi:hypothetical protein ACIP93_33505 [Streptomyces sp. NPDC088745]|uniref:hypothetical protein n=1 Tax=Streptomyces sp. NPDC088745 TaxID=3365884 RepID=UPI0038095179
MTIFDAIPHNWPLRTAFPGEEDASSPLLDVENSVDFVIASEVSPVEAMERAVALSAVALPRMLQGAPDLVRTCDNVKAVLAELVDVTARNQASDALIARIAYDGAHVTVSVGEMGRPLPAPEEEPGLYLVHRIASEVGQYAGDHGGRVTWAAVAAGT